MMLMSDDCVLFCYRDNNYSNSSDQRPTTTHYCIHDVSEENSTIKRLLVNTNWVQAECKGTQPSQRKTLYSLKNRLGVTQTLRHPWAVETQQTCDMWLQHMPLHCGNMETNHPHVSTRRLLQLQSLFTQETNSHSQVIQMLSAIPMLLLYTQGLGR